MAFTVEEIRKRTCFHTPQRTQIENYQITKLSLINIFYLIYLILLC
jgi:hypothetical protein